MRYRIYPQKSDVLAMFLARLEVAELSYDYDLAAELREEIALIQSHGPTEIACELED